MAEVMRRDEFHRYFDRLGRVECLIEQSICRLLTTRTVDLLTCSKEKSKLPGGQDCLNF